MFCQFKILFLQITRRKNMLNHPLNPSSSNNERSFLEETSTINKTKDFMSRSYNKCFSRKMTCISIISYIGTYVTLAASCYAIINPDKFCPSSSSLTCTQTVSLIGCAGLIVSGISNSAWWYVHCVRETN